MPKYLKILEDILDYTGTSKLYSKGEHIKVVGEDAESYHLANGLGISKIEKEIIKKYKTVDSIIEELVNDVKAEVKKIEKSKKNTEQKVEVPVEPIVETPVVSVDETVKTEEVTSVAIDTVVETPVAEEDKSENV